MNKPCKQSKKESSCQSAWSMLFNMMNIKSTCIEAQTIVRALSQVEIVSCSREVELSLPLHIDQSTA